MSGRRAHDFGEASDLLGRLAFHAQSDREASDLRRGRLALDQRGHRGAGFGAREVLAEDEFA
jgi:hypothetical protein